MNALLWVCFALSGAGALGLELLWMRSAGLVLGTTAATAATVVAGYFLGLAGGAWLARQPPTRPIRRYAALELAVAAGALGSWGICRLLGSETGQAALAALGAGARVLVVALTIVPVTLALGATLPTLCHALATPSMVGQRGGALYALNTLGGGVGIAAVGFGLPAAIGVGATYAVVASANALAGLVALWIGDGAADTRSAARPPATSQGWMATLAAATVGFVGMSLEIFWVVLFAQVLHNSVYSFAAVTLVFVLALAAGAELSALLLRAVSPNRVAVAGLVIAGITTVVGVWAFVHVTDGLQYFGMRRGLLEYVGRIAGLAAVTAGPGTFAAGLVLPALWAVFGQQQSVARSVGGLTAANLLGGAIGAAAAAFVVLPWLGLRGGFLVAAVVYLLLAAALAEAEPRLRALAYASLVAVVILDPMHAPATRLNDGEALRVALEGSSGIVTVVDTGNDLQLRLDNYYVLGGSAAARNERRQGLIPLLLHPDPRRVAFLGMATGISASAAIGLGVGDTTVIEVVPEVAAVARSHFGPWNAGLLERRDVRLIVDDGRRYLAAPGAPFDVIVSDLFIPWHASAGNLYALEMYETARRRLADGGLFCQWLPLYQLTREEFEVIVHTFLVAFPHATLWRNDFFPNRPVLGLVGSRQPLRLDLDRIGRRLNALPEWSRDSFLVAPRAMAMLYVADLSLVPDLVAHAPLNRDVRPVLEFLAPRLTRMNAAGDKDWLTGLALADWTDRLAARLDGRPDPTLPGTPDVAEARRAGAKLFRYAIAATRQDSAAAGALMREIAGLVPDVIASAAPEAAGADLANVRRTLGTLQVEQERLRQQLQSMEQRLRAGPSNGERR